MDRWEALFGIGTVAILFMPIVLSMMAGGVNRTRQLRETERERRLAAYRRSPESQLLILNN